MERDKYKQLYNEANNALKLSAKLSANYLVNNREQITKFLNEKLNYITDLQKAKIKQKNRTMYLKKSQYLIFHQKQNDRGTKERIEKTNKFKVLQ